MGGRRSQRAKRERAVALSREVVEKQKQAMGTREELGKIADGTNLKDGIIKRRHIPNGEIGPSQLASASGTSDADEEARAVRGDHIKTNAVGTRQLGNAAVTDTQLAANAVKAGKIHAPGDGNNADRPVVTDTIKDKAVTDAKLNENYLKVADHGAHNFISDADDAVKERHIEPTYMKKSDFVEDPQGWLKFATNKA